MNNTEIDRDSEERLPYESPDITDHGDIDALTQGTGSDNPSSDLAYS